MNDKIKKHILPFSLSLIVFAADQITKALIVQNVKIGQIVKVFDDFLWIWHSRNRAMAFGLGNNLPEPFLSIVAIILPLIVVIVLLFGYFKLKDITNLQKTCIAIAMGGGLGNLADRFIRSGGVVDFISVKVFGFLGYDRWPTFNIADTVVVIILFILLFSVIFSELNRNKKDNKNE